MIWRVFAGLMEKLCQVPERSVVLEEPQTTKESFVTLSTKLSTIAQVVETTTKTTRTKTTTKAMPITVTKSVEETATQTTTQRSIGLLSTRQETTTIRPIPTSASPITVVAFPGDFKQPEVNQTLKDLPILTNITVVHGKTVIVDNVQPEDAEVTEEMIPEQPTQFTPEEFISALQV